MRRFSTGFLLTLLYAFLYKSAASTYWKVLKALSASEAGLDFTCAWDVPMKNNDNRLIHNTLYDFLIIDVLNKFQTAKVAKKTISLHIFIRNFFSVQQMCISIVLLLV